MYSLIRPLLFRLEPEKSHDVVMAVLASLSSSALAMRGMHAYAGRRTSADPQSLMGLPVPGALGLAAGLDKDALAFPALQALGFAWVETGTVTLRPQRGNPRPRVFRLEESKAIINRMGFNSCGLDRFLENLEFRKKHYTSRLGINIGKNAETPIEEAATEYVACLERVYPYADYVAINISSPNTKSLRDLQQERHLSMLLKALVAKRRNLEGLSGRYVPMAVKLSPDLSDAQIDSAVELVEVHGIDGVIATNTTTERPASLVSRQAHESGGLSGPPLAPQANRVIRRLNQFLDRDTAIVGVGGISDADGVSDKRRAGARLFQCYTLFIYEGAAGIEKLNAALESIGNVDEIPDERFRQP